MAPRWPVPRPCATSRYWMRSMGHPAVTRRRPGRGGALSRWRMRRAGGLPAAADGGRSRSLSAGRGVPAEGTARRSPCLRCRRPLRPEGRGTSACVTVAVGTFLSAARPAGTAETGVPVVHPGGLPPPLPPGRPAAGRALRPGHAERGAGRGRHGCGRTGLAFERLGGALGSGSERLARSRATVESRPAEPREPAAPPGPDPAGLRDYEMIMSAG